jgi:hypothetical protein
MTIEIDIVVHGRAVTDIAVAEVAVGAEAELQNVIDTTVAAEVATAAVPIDPIVVPKNHTNEKQIKWEKCPPNRSKKNKN